MSSESLHGWLVCLLAAVVAAPLVASAAVWLGIASKSPRTPAVTAMIVSLVGRTTSGSSSLPVGISLPSAFSSRR